MKPSPAALVTLLGAALAIACVPTAPSEPAAPLGTPSEGVQVASSPHEAPREPTPAASTGISSPPAGEEQAGARPPKVPFPPPPVTPPVARTARVGDGEWQPVAEAPALQGRPLLYRTTLHPHPHNKWVYVVLVAIDLTRAELSLVAGTKEPVNPGISAEERRGLVPLEVQDRLIAVFNGGFQEAHGHYGMRLGGKQFVKPRPDACTIVLRTPSHIEIGTFDDLRLGADEDYRQTPPCLVEQGKPHPLLERTPKKWGGAEDGRKDIRRTALAIDETGNVLYFAFADWITASELSNALVHAGVKSAAELDINWSFTRFLFFGPAEDGSGLEVTGTLVDQIEHRKRGYVQKAEPRDFFYLTVAPTPRAP